MAGIEGGSSSSSCGTARQSLVRFQKRKHVLCLFSSFQTPADTSNIHRKAGARIYGIKHTHTPMHTADDSYKYNRTRVRSDCYTILKALLFKLQLCVKKRDEGESGVTNARHTLHTASKNKTKGFPQIEPDISGPSRT